MSYLIITLIIIISSIAYLKLADKFNIIDRPTERGSHRVPTIRGGGILFVFALILFTITSKMQYPYFIIGTLIITTVSFIDDLVTLSSKLRMPFQIIAVAFLLIQVLGVEFNWMLFLLLIFIGVGFINLYNFMDGINGITGIYSISVLLGLFFLNKEANDFINEQLFFYEMIAIAVFGYYNFRKKALCFAGDIGSIGIAMILFFIGLTLSIELKAPIILLCFIVYYTDSILTILYRIYIRESVGKPHRRHIYQKLTDAYQFSHLKIAIGYAVLQLIINIIVLKCYRLSMLNQLLIIIFAMCSFLALYVVFFKKVENKKRLIFKNGY